MAGAHGGARYGGRVRVLVSLRRRGYLVGDTITSAGRAALTPPIREADVEAYLVKQVRARGGDALKFTSPGRRHVPDRLVTAPSGGVVLVEVKAPGQKPRVAQVREHMRLRAAGFVVVVVDSFDAVDATVKRFL